MNERVSAGEDSPANSKQDIISNEFIGSIHPVSSRLHIFTFHDCPVSDLQRK